MEYEKLNLLLYQTIDMPYSVFKVIRRIQRDEYDVSGIQSEEKQQIVLLQNVDQSILYGVSADVDTTYSSKSGNVYQIDIKSAFLNGKISDEVYVQQPPRFESSEFPNHVCKLDKALYGLKQALRAWYLKGTPNLGLWYLKGPGFNLKAYSDSDYAGCNLDRKSTSVAKVEYVVAVGCCAQVLWIKSQLADYDILYDKVPIFCDNTSAIAISNNQMLHSKTKHIDIRYHFIRDHILNDDIELHFVPTDMKLADIFTKALVKPRFTRLVVELGMLNIDKYNENYVPLPPKETMRTALATLGLVDEKDTSLSSTNLVNSSPLRTRYFSPIWRVIMMYIVKCLGGMHGSHDQLNINQQIIAYSLCWGLDIDISNILFSDLVAKLTTGKKGREPNICYTRYLSLIIEHLLRSAYKNDKLKTFKSHQISTTSFKTPSASEVPLISHMLKVHAEEPVATADATKSIETSKLAKELGSQPKLANAEKVHETIIEEVVKDSGITSLGNVTFEELYGHDNNMGADESPFDTDSEIKFPRKIK
ncbi:retrovirus-related pol polyprotein from transposon TNT 1-94 [Tanacetum coccineum]